MSFREIPKVDFAEASNMTQSLVVVLENLTTPCEETDDSSLLRTLTGTGSAWPSSSYSCRTLV